MTYLEYLKDFWYKKSLLHSQLRFIGYNIKTGGKYYGTLQHVKPEKCIETPIAENTMVGLGMGMALTGFHPVVCFERHDFLLCGLDAIANHLDKLPWMSGEQFKMPVMIRACVGGTKPLDAGCQHTNDYTLELNSMLKYISVTCPTTQEDYEKAFNEFLDGKRIVVIEHKDAYNQEYPITSEELHDYREERRAKRRKCAEGA